MQHSVPLAVASLLPASGGGLGAWWQVVERCWGGAALQLSRAPVACRTARSSALGGAHHIGRSAPRFVLSQE